MCESEYTYLLILSDLLCRKHKTSLVFEISFFVYTAPVKFEQWNLDKFQNTPIKTEYVAGVLDQQRLSIFHTVT